MFLVKQKFTVVDKYQVKYKIAEVEHSDLPSWVQGLIPDVDRKDVRYALDRYADPLVRKFPYTPAQCLDRIGQVYKLCAIRKGCFGWRLDKCSNLKTNTCALLVMPGKDDSESAQLTELVNLWRDECQVISVKTDL